MQTALKPMSEVAAKLARLAKFGTLSSSRTEGDFKVSVYQLGRLIAEAWQHVTEPERTHVIYKA